MALSGKVWGGGEPLLARWTTDWDCGYETNWWYVIKDEPFDINSLKSKNRYYVNKGCKYFDVKLIDPRDYKEQLYNVQVAAFSAYPKKYRPTVDRDAFLSSIDEWEKCDVFGAFYKETAELEGYVLMTKNYSQYYGFAVQKTNPQYEKLQINAALVKGVMDYYEDFLSSGGIICDGERSISHETHFQDYLEKYFGFRKAYCHLHVAYNPKIKWAVKLLYPFRKLLHVFDMLGFVHMINGVLKMEDIIRDDKFNQCKGG